MRTTVSINDQLLVRAKRLLGTSSQSEVVNAGLAALVRDARRKDLLEWIDRGQTGMSLKQLDKLRRGRGGRSR